MTEAQEQEMLFQWAELKSGMYPDLRLMFHIPNGGKRDKVEAAHMKKQGVKSGVPDIFLPVPMWGWHGLFIEMKRADGGRLSKEQRRYIKELSDQDYNVQVCHGFDEASQVILDYLGGRL